jgi:pimeloyl-ACP methyl ester carboxylesterase
MRVDANGTRLWFDVDGSAYVPSGRDLRQRPTVVLVHGGPGGFDHSYFKPDFGRLTAYAQVVYLDLRGHGRSAWGEPAQFTFEDCADDLRAFCDAVGIVRPIVLGHSMGGPIVLLYGTRHPGHAAGLVIQSGFARWDAPRLVEGFRRVGGDRIADCAERSFAGEPVTDDEDARVFAAFGPRVPDDDQLARRRQNPDLNAHGMKLIRHLDIVDQLVHIDAPTLVSVGDLDPVTPVGAAEEIVAGLPVGLGRLEIVPNAGHFPWLDAPDEYWLPLIDFVRSLTPAEPIAA